jgi:NADPH:quinone reductase
MGVINVGVTSMKAVGIAQYLPVEDENAFVDFEMEKPEATGHDLLVEVRSIAVNPVRHQGS